MGTSGTKVLLLKRRNFMLDWLWLFLPLAFYHGWLTGRSHGVRLGAAGMFDELFQNGTPTSKSGVRKIEVSIDDRDTE